MTSFFLSSISSVKFPEFKVFDHSICSKVLSDWDPGIRRQWTSQPEASPFNIASFCCRHAHFRTKKVFRALLRAPCSRRMKYFNKLSQAYPSLMSSRKPRCWLKSWPIRFVIEPLIITATCLRVIQALQTLSDSSLVFINMFHWEQQS